MQWKNLKRLMPIRERTAYWESMANKIDLSMPESLEFFEIQLEEGKRISSIFKRQPKRATSRNGLYLMRAKK